MATKTPSPELQAILDELAIVAPKAAAAFAARRAKEKERNEAIVDAWLAGAKNRDLALRVGVSAPRITMLVKRGLEERQRAALAEGASSESYTNTPARKGSAA